MRVKKSAIAGIVLSLVILLAPAQGVVIEPTNVVMPSAAGETFSFDYAIYDATGTSARAFQSTVISVGGSGLTFDATASEAVSSAGNYWLYGNSGGAGAIDLGSNSYQFGDDPFDGLAQSLAVGDIMARYSFTWDGTAADFTFTLDTSISNSFVMNEFFTNEALGFTPGQYPGQGSSFGIYIPEPSTMVLLALGGAGLLKRRRR
jgi:hypothetical protein